MAPWTVKKLKVLPGHRLEVVFADGLSGVVEIPKDGFSGMLAPLADEAFFAQAAIHEGAVTWPNGVDLAPDAMYDEVLASQRASA